MKLALIIGTLEMGGAERVVTTLANAWAGEGHQVTIVVLRGADHQPFYPLDPPISLVKLGVAWQSRNIVHAALSNLVRARAIRKALRQVRPDVAISFMDSVNVLTVIAARATGVPVIVTEHCAPLRSASAIWGLARKLAYRRADWLVVLTENAVKFHTERGLANVRKIPNPVFRPEVSGEPAIPIERPVVAAMGRLVDIKGFDVLIRAFSETRASHPEWSLVIMGEGPMRQSLESLRDSLGLTECVQLPGIVHKPQNVLAQSDIFVLASQTEAFPMALCEAMAAGLPVVSTDCPTGPGEIVRPGIDGILTPVGDVRALAVGMLLLMGDETLRASMAERASEITDRFSPTVVLERWAELFKECTGGRRSGSS